MNDSTKFTIPDSNKGDKSMNDLHFYKWLKNNNIYEKRRKRKRGYEGTNAKFIPDIRVIRAYLRALGFVFRKNTLYYGDLGILQHCLRYYNKTGGKA